MSKDKEIQDLLKPRIKLMAGWPGCGWPIGTIFPENFIKDWENYPHLFRKLQWWEDRDNSKFTKYVKYTEYDGVRVIKSEQLHKDDKRDRRDIGYDDYWFGSTHISCFQPATEEEYNSYISKQKI